MKLSCTINKDQSISLDIVGRSTKINGKNIDYQLNRVNSDEYQLIASGKTYEIKILSIEDKHVWLLVDDYEMRVDTKNELDLMMIKLGVGTDSSSEDLEIKAPMPGTILDIMVSPDQKVKKGDSLLVLNAMKMENVIKAPGDAQIDKIKVSSGENVNKNQVMITFKAQS
ncbi:MAG: acetyl-CoA carboxylase biotin carboxyl carrier protein subunit [Bacteroidota bacterium]